METIPEGYRLAVLSPQGTILDTIDLEGYALEPSNAASVILAADAFQTVRRDMEAQA